jgi:hypothetical protein
MADRDLAEWDREIEAEFQHCIAGTRARAAAKRTRKEKDRFVRVPLWWIAAAAKLTHSPTTLVLIELLHTKFRAKSSTFKFSNVRLEKLGVNRECKSQVLRKLARGKGRLIVVEQEAGKAPRVTLIGL